MSLSISFGPLPKMRVCNHLIFLKADLFAKLTQLVPLKLTTVIDVVKAFASHFVFNYAPPEDFLSDNGPKFMSKLYENKCRILCIPNTFASSYNLQINGQVELFDCSIATMLRCYLSDHPDNLNEYPEPLTHAYNTQSSSHRHYTPVRPSSVTLSHLFQPPFPQLCPTIYRKNHANFVKQLQKAI